MEWVKPYLVNVLTKPSKFEGVPAIKLSSLPNKGLSDKGFTKEGSNELNKVFRFAYMGASEYEWGAIPLSMKRFADGINAGEYVATYVTVNHIVPNLDKRGRLDMFSKGGTPAETKVFIMCHKSHVDKVEEFLNLASQQKYGVTRDYIQMDEVLYPDKSKIKAYIEYAIGGLDLDNNFIYLTDKIAIHYMCKLFDIKVK